MVVTPEEVPAQTVAAADPDTDDDSASGSN